ncbi:MAG: tRNA (adenosine(37)-N6)-threonylcarbamoyltransferase complex dimerization subunit type 1 TsaB [Phascolarctobacterium sp.]|nr:tRNA (adenosine(37)-N6)-threonylcarbamoyltransferase complex dimerization subunit type 1 TsaB [Phascolarctobacterium sp.]
MLTLAIDTATKICSVALCRDREIISEYNVDAGMTHSAHLVPQIEKLFNECTVKKSDIDLVAVSIGPGSFTGLRIGLATAEALAYTWQCSLHGVETLKGMAYNMPREGILLSPVLNAQKGNYYQGIYKWQSGKVEELQSACVVGKEELFSNIASIDMPAMLLGECDKLMQDKLPENIMVAPEGLLWPKAASVALAAIDAFNAETDKNIFGIKPYYIRKSEAEELWEKRQKQK